MLHGNQASLQFLVSEKSYLFSRESAGVTSLFAKTCIDPLHGQIKRKFFFFSTVSSSRIIAAELYRTVISKMYRTLSDRVAIRPDKQR